MPRPGLYYPISLAEPVFYEHGSERRKHRCKFDGRPGAKRRLRQGRPVFDLRRHSCTIPALSGVRQGTSDMDRPEGMYDRDVSNCWSADSGRPTGNCVASHRSEGGPQYLGRVCVPLQPSALSLITSQL
ncbi:hypothetical protein J6590_077417 [Homalodisca vitripennis]|nr:hypothetical protein J6590_077417 [Homalodisca vitripennis]